ncbi:MAG: MarR family transcriptional regulator [Flavobacteriales bacterium]|nr:MarR family transcriptional regulator [Flavobacteriales bacterium]
MYIHIMFIHIFVFMNLEQSISQAKFDSEQEKLMINVIYSANLLNLITTRLFKPFDLSLQQYNVLRILRGQKGSSIALMEIENRMLDKSSNVSRLVDKLISKDLVNRSVCSEDRRRIEILITSNGISILKEIDAILSEMNSKLKELISDDDANQTNRILDHLREIQQYY